MAKNGFMLHAEHNLLTLSGGEFELVLCPSLGGAIHGFSWVRDGQRVPLLRASREGADSVLDMASFPLVPYVNRIRDGRFAFRGQEIVLTPNLAGDMSPLHGQGWLGEWDVDGCEESRAELRFEHEAGEWPWRYQARQVVELDAGGMSLRLECRNRDTTPMPCGLGQHPYFPCGPETRIDTQVRTVFEIDENVLPTGEVTATGRFDLGDRAVCGQRLDHGFGGWGGFARLRDPAWPGALQLSSPTARFFQLYSPESGGIFVAEPVTHANAALNEPEERWAELGLQVLEPGEAMHLDMRLELVR
jgi:aldose 1-epimerase